MSTFITERRFGNTQTGRSTTIRHAALLAVALVAAILFAQAISATNAQAASVVRENYVTAGDYRTVATLWNTTAVGEFRCPAGAKIRVRYGVWPFEYNRQQQDLDCQTAKRLSVGSWSLVRAKMQIKVPTSTWVTWTYITEGP
jgi:hypothetical protein